MLIRKWYLYSPPPQNEVIYEASQPEDVELWFNAQEDLPPGKYKIKMATKKVGRGRKKERPQLNLFHNKELTK